MQAIYCENRNGATLQNVAFQRSLMRFAIPFSLKSPPALKFLRHITETDVRHTSAAMLMGLLEESKERRAG
jgi:hypothetical protein